MCAPSAATQLMLSKAPSALLSVKNGVPEAQTYHSCWDVSNY